MTMPLETVGSKVRNIRPETMPMGTNFSQKHGFNGFVLGKNWVCFGFNWVCFDMSKNAKIITTCLFLNFYIEFNLGLFRNF